MNEFDVQFSHVVSNQITSHFNFSSLTSKASYENNERRKSNTEYSRLKSGLGRYFQNVPILDTVLSSFILLVGRGKYIHLKYLFPNPDPD